MVEKLTPDEEMEISEKTRQFVLRLASPKELLAGLDPQDILAGLDPQDILAGLTPRERLAGLTNAQRRELLQLLQEEVDAASEDMANRNEGTA